ncbi:MAG: hypothetical protein QXL01_01560 [Thermoplasmatales archaeon]
MIEKVLQNVRLMRAYLGFLLTLISVMGCLVLAWFKGTDIEFMLPTILGIYISAKTVERTTAVWSASRDSKADTRAILRDMDDHTQ